MASKGTWSVVFDDKTVVKKTDDFANNPTGYAIDDSVFWNQSKFNNIWAIQYGTSNPSDTVEYRDTTPHSNWEDANLGDFSDFTTRWDSAHLSQLQLDWDEDNVDNETSEEKITRLGAKPTSYSS